MSGRAWGLLSILLVLGTVLLSQGQAPVTTKDVPPGDVSRPRIAAAYGNLPLSFEANHGQTDSQVNFVSRGSGYTLFLTPTEAVLALRKTASPPKHATDTMPTTMEPEATESTPPAVLHMKLVGSNPAPQVEGVDELPGKSNYFIGNDPKKWRTNVPQFRKVRYRGVYPGIDLVYYGTNHRQLEYDFIVAPGADPNTIRLAFDGADQLTLDDRGNLIVEIEGNEVVLRAPFVYQESESTRQTISGRYVVNSEHQIGFEVASYDVSEPLIIDPVLSYSTYLGGSGPEVGVDIAVDSFGNAYVMGSLGSTDFPTTAGAFDTTCGGCPFLDVFVTKLNADGSALVYSTYLGGSLNENGGGIAVDIAGNAYVTGHTTSTDFPTTPGAFQTSGGGTSVAAFVTKLDPAGSTLIYSTYLGGGSGKSIAVDSSGNAYVTGQTSSTGLPTTTFAFQRTKRGLWDAFVTKFDAAGSTLVYSTYLGGGGNDFGSGIALDASGNAYVTGWTFSSDFPTANAFQPAFGGGTCNFGFGDFPCFDVFVAKLDTIGSTLVYSTFLGGNDNDQGRGIAADSSGSAYVTGHTRSANFPTTNPLQSALGGFDDAFVTKLDTNATGAASLVYSTYLGGAFSDIGLGIAVDSSGNAHVAGNTGSTDFPTTNPLQAAKAGDRDVFVTEFNAGGSFLLFSSYLGGSGDDVSGGIAVDSFGNVYVTGSTQSTDFPKASPLQSACNNCGVGNSDAFVAKISPALDAETQFVYTNNDISPNTVSAFSVGPDGSLTEIASSPFPTGGDGLGSGLFASNRITIAGNFLYVSDSASNDVSAFSIDSATGSLTPVPGSPFPTGGLGTSGISLAGTPDGRFLMTGNSNSANITVFSIGGDGSLTPVAGSPFHAGGLPDGMKVTPDGKSLAVALLGSVAMFSIASDGSLTSVPGSPFPDGGVGSAAAVDINCASNLLFAGEANIGNTIVDVFSIASDGSLTPIVGSPFVAGVGSNSNVPLLSPDDRILFVSNQNSQSVTVFSVAIDGTLTLVPGSPFAVGGAAFPTGMATNQSGTFLFTANSLGAVNVFNVASDGTLTPVSGSPFSTGQPSTFLTSLTSFLPKACVTPTPNTPAGANVVVNLVSGPGGGSNTVTFANVTQAGNTSMTISSAGPAPPSGFKLGNPPTYFDLTTTAVFSGTVQVCIDYSGISFGNEAALKLFHFEGGVWVDATVSLDTTSKIICANVTSLSAFAIFEPEANQPPVADAGPDQTGGCSSATGTLVALNGAASSDPDGDSLAFSWTGPFPEGGGTVTGVNPAVTLPLGTHTITLVVNDGQVDSAPDTVTITVTAGVVGLLSPLGVLVPEGDSVPLPNKAFKQGRTLPLKLQLFCGSTPLTDSDVAPPQIVGLVRAGDASVDLEAADLDAGEANDSGLLFRFSDTNWVYNLSTKDLIPGTYVITIQIPDGRRYIAAFDLK